LTTSRAMSVPLSTALSLDGDRGPDAPARAQTSAATGAGPREPCSAQRSTAGHGP